MIFSTPIKTGRIMEVIIMAETKMWDYTDEQISAAITYCHDKFMNSANAEDAKEWKDIETLFLREQRERMDLMLKDETEACKLSDEANKFKYEQEKDGKNLEFEEKKLKTSKILKVGEIVVGLVGSAATVISAVLNYNAKKIEFDTKKESWDRICQYEESGEIPLQQPNKFIKL